MKFEKIRAISTAINNISQLTISMVKSLSMSRLSVVVLFFIACIAPSFAKAVSGDEYLAREQCFTTLKENLVEASAVVPSAALVELEKTSYRDLDTKFSQNYKNLSSFGIELSEPSLEMRVYSFGSQTGYVHPPKLPFPAYYESDTWAAPAKEFIVAEEYAVDENAQRYFISCAFFAIQAENLLEVTSENYAYDGAAVSLTKVDGVGSYKAWYSQNTSYNYQDEPFVDWTRLFIYPKETQNAYFDKYSVAEAFPAHSVQSFDVLKFFEQHLIMLQDFNEAGEMETKYVMLDNDHKVVEVNRPDALSPVIPQGLDQTFPFTSYYQAIEDRFPSFAKSLSLRGTLNFETYKKLLVIPELDPEIEKLLDVVMDPRQLTKYSIEQESKEKEGVQMSDSAMDQLLLDVRNIDAIAVSALDKTGAVASQEDDSIVLNQIFFWVVSVSVCLVAISILVVSIWRRKFKFTNNSI